MTRESVARRLMVAIAVLRELVRGVKEQCSDETRDELEKHLEEFTVQVRRFVLMVGTPFKPFRSCGWMYKSRASMGAKVIGALGDADDWLHSMWGCGESDKGADGAHAVFRRAEQALKRALCAVYDIESTAALFGDAHVRVTRQLPLPVVYA